MNKEILRAALGLGLACLALPLALAQTGAPAEARNDPLLLQQQRERALREQQERRPDVRLQPATRSEDRLPAQESPCVQVNHLQLTGDSADRFSWALESANRLPSGEVDAATPRCLGSSGMNLVMRRIQEAIAARGYPAARILAGPDALAESGTLRLTLWPGRIGKIRFAPGTSERASRMNALPMREGDLLRLPDLEQSLENFQRVPTVQANIDLLPSEGPQARPGESDLEIHWQQSRLLRGSLGLDDSGTRATGKYLGTLTASCDHCLQLNDLFYVSATRALGGSDPGSRGTQSDVAHYSLPMGYWLLSGTVSRNRYWQIVAGVDGPVSYSGHAEQAELRLSRVVLRDARRKLTLAMRGWARNSRNFIEDVELETQRSRMAGWGATLAYRQFFTPAILDLSLDYRRGTGAAHAITPPEESRGEGTSRLQLVLADGQLSVPFRFGSLDLRYTGNARAQWNRTPLVPLDRFAIGSRYTVRGFSGERQLVGERGVLWRNELALALPRAGHELYFGLDYGAVSGKSSEQLIGKELAGTVLGWRGQEDQFNWDVFAGAPVSRPTSFGSAGPVFGFNLGLVF